MNMQQRNLTQSQEVADNLSSFINPTQTLSESSSGNKPEGGKKQRHMACATPQLQLGCKKVAMHHTPRQHLNRNTRSRSARSN